MGFGRSRQPGGAVCLHPSDIGEGGCYRLTAPLQIHHWARGDSGQSSELISPRMCSSQFPVTRVVIVTLALCQLDVRQYSDGEVRTTACQSIYTIKITGPSTVSLCADAFYCGRDATRWRISGHVIGHLVGHVIRHTSSLSFRSTLPSGAIRRAAPWVHYLSMAVKAARATMNLLSFRRLVRCTHYLEATLTDVVC